MQPLGGEDRQFGGVVAEVHLKPHLVLFGQGPEALGDLRARDLEPLQIPFHARQKDSCLQIGVLVGVQDVTAVAKDETGNLGHQPFPVGAAD